MAKKIKNIVLTKNKTKVEIKDVDGWIFDLRYLVNGRESYRAQILKTDIQGRIERLEREGFKKSLQNRNENRMKNLVTL
jgi:hypothetical protein